MGSNHFRGENTTEDLQANKKYQAGLVMRKDLGKSRAMQGRLPLKSHGKVA